MYRGNCDKLYIISFAQRKFNTEVEMAWTGNLLDLEDSGIMNVNICALINLTDRFRPPVENIIPGNHKSR